MIWFYHCAKFYGQDLEGGLGPAPIYNHKVRALNTDYKSTRNKLAVLELRVIE